MSTAALRADQKIIKLASSDAPVVARTARPLTVRMADPSDRARIFELFMMAADENAMAPVSEKKVNEAITSAVDRKGAIIGIIDGSNGEIAGAVGLIMAPYWYTEQWHCEEMLNFVHPNYRAGALHCARDLIQFAKWWSEQLGMSLIMGVLSHHRTEGKVRLYRRMLPFAGALFLYRGGAV